MLTRDAILQADDLERVLVSVPEWGGDIYVRELTALESLVYDQWLIDNKDNNQAIASGFHAMIVMLCACDDKGQRLFNDDDLPYLQGKNPVIIERISEAAQKLNKIGTNDFEEEVGNSESGQTVASISASA